MAKTVLPFETKIDMTKIPAGVLGGLNPLQEAIQMSTGIYGMLTVLSNKKYMMMQRAGGRILQHIKFSAAEVDHRLGFEWAFLRGLGNMAVPSALGAALLKNIRTEERIVKTTFSKLVTQITIKQRDIIFGKNIYYNVIMAKIASLHGSIMSGIENSLLSSAENEIGYVIDIDTAKFEIALSRGHILEGQLVQFSSDKAAKKTNQVDGGKVFKAYFVRTAEYVSIYRLHLFDPTNGTISATGSIPANLKAGDVVFPYGGMLSDDTEGMFGIPSYINVKVAELDNIGQSWGTRTDDVFDSGFKYETIDPLVVTTEEFPIQAKIGEIYSDLQNFMVEDPILLCSPSAYAALNKEAKEGIKYVSNDGKAMDEINLGVNKVKYILPYGGYMFSDIVVDRNIPHGQMIFIDPETWQLKTPIDYNEKHDSQAYELFGNIDVNNPDYEIEALKILLSDSGRNWMTSGFDGQYAIIPQFDTGNEPSCEVQLTRYMQLVCLAPFRNGVIKVHPNSLPGKGVNVLP